MHGVLHSPSRSRGFRGRHPPGGARRAFIHSHAAIHRALHFPRSSIWRRPTHPRCCTHGSRQHRSRLHSRPGHPSAAGRFRTPPQHRLAALHPCSADGPYARGTVDDGSVSGRFAVATGRRAQSPVGRIPAGLDDGAVHSRCHRPSLGEVAATAMASATPSRTRFRVGRPSRDPALHHPCADDARLPGGTPPRRGRVADRRTPEVRTRPRIAPLLARAVPRPTRQRRVGSPSSVGSDHIRLGTGAGIGTRAAPDRAVPGDECGSRSVHLRPRRPSQPNDHRSGRA